MRKKIGEILFWLHSGVIFFGLFLGLFVSLPVLFSIIFVHIIHMIAFGGCLISTLQNKYNTIPGDRGFLEYAI